MDLQFEKERMTEMEWFDAYPKCPYFSAELAENDPLGHDTFNHFCSKSEEKREITPRVHCKNCSFVLDIELLKKLIDESKTNQ